MRSLRVGWRTALPLAAASLWLGLIVLARGPDPVPGPARLLDFLAAWVAALTQAGLTGLGVAAERAGTLLYVPGGFAYDVSIGCTGLVPAAVLAVAILAAPETRSAKRWGLVVGVPLVLTVNLLRLVHLFYIGVHAPRRFVLAHAALWEATLVLFTFATWLVWSTWAAQGARLARPAKS